MEREMTGADRRKRLLALMRESDTPLSGTSLGSQTGVSRRDCGTGYCAASYARVSHRIYCKRIFSCGGSTGCPLD